MQKLETESYAMVGVQFLCIALLIYFLLGVPLAILTVIMITVATGLGLWAIFTMRFGNIRIQPVPKEDAQLISGGPYRLMRHPMYAAVLLAMLGVAINIGTWYSYVIWIILLLDLLIKLRFEEKLLLGKFPEYREYMKHTKRLLPWLW
ncbi:MAG: isoprenylcysteine carboxylmethyltransferase family protein [Bacteroidota bacterium]|nr:isoprenylcysteine carboxylmethyltransferase family protein [Bacteroidota bacterium]MDP4230379.1 isoprenylcysteine carboxylmethyltransferase family protein [Bacteroidota bacterium]MDP4237563.1 isoprenylcysteine carboxylmethyltransferase family protein [Bacteroidota bacterium]